MAGGIFFLVSASHGATNAPPHWAFQPVSRIEPPSVRPKSWSRNPIDQFILVALEANRLKPNPPATKEQLIRRVTYGLVGLPPTPEEIDAFVSDRSPDAYEKVIERLLASPHYGEHWARHWLDLARYAESDGFEHDALRPHSWRYRDYVVKSFNEDKPYDRFIREQIAGDELWPGEPDALIATAFHLLGPDMVDSADQVQRRLNTLNDATDTMASVFLGLTFGCARCHHHKFEPFTQRDYFAMQAFFTPAVFQRELPVPTAVELTAHDEAMTRYRAEADATQKRLDELEASYRGTLYSERLAKLSEDAQLAHRTPKARRTMEQDGTVAETAPMLQFTDAELVRRLAKNDQAEHRRLLDALKAIPKPPPLPVTMALQNKIGPPPKTFVLARGDYNNPGEEVEPGFPAVLLSSRGSEAPNKAEMDQSLRTSVAPKRRALLADWIASPTNPLTARVMVNRIWQHHFGRGLVATAGDFGTRGARPVHPELLDWLAGEFIARGWSVKAMHRLILASAAYQQSSGSIREVVSGSVVSDPVQKGRRTGSLSTDSLIADYSPLRLRLEGEAVRDSLLAISGRLNRQMGGPSVSPPIPADITRTSKNWTTSAAATDHTRRSLYILARRNLRFPFLEVFDAPDSNLPCPERGRSTTAPQSLTLLNSDEVLSAAGATAARLLKEAETTEARVTLAFRLTLGRPPTTKERAMAGDFLNSSASRRQDALTKAEVAKRNSPVDQSLLASAAPEDWAELCRALFNLNAFVYVE